MIDGCAWGMFTAYLPVFIGDRADYPSSSAGRQKRPVLGSERFAAVSCVHDLGHGSNLTAICLCKDDFDRTEPVF